MQDNSDIQTKIQLRSRFLGELPADFTVVDFYAGEGTLTRLFWRHHAAKVVCVERDPQRAQRIPCDQTVQVCCADNRDCLSLAQQADVFDCDAYGLVMPFIATLAQHGGQGKRVFFTDGTPHKARKVFSATAVFKRDCDRLLQDVDVIYNPQGGVYYGTGVIK